MPSQSETGTVMDDERKLIGMIKAKTMYDMVDYIDDVAGQRQVLYLSTDQAQFIGRRPIRASRCVCQRCGNSGYQDRTVSPRPQ